MAGRPKKRSLTIAGHRTSISLEDDFWTALHEVAQANDRSVPQFIAEIDKSRGELGLSSAIRSAFWRTSGHNPTPATIDADQFPVSAKGIETRLRRRTGGSATGGSGCWNWSPGITFGCGCGNGAAAAAEQAVALAQVLVQSQVDRMGCPVATTEGCSTTAAERSRSAMAEAPLPNTVIPNAVAPECRAAGPERSAPGRGVRPARPVQGLTVFAGGGVEACGAAEEPAELAQWERRRQRRPRRCCGRRAALP